VPRFEPWAEVCAGGVASPSGLNSGTAQMHMHRGHAGHLGSFVGRADRQARRGTSVARGAAACCHGDAIAAWRTPPGKFFRRQ